MSPNVVRNYDLAMVLFCKKMVSLITIIYFTVDQSCTLSTTSVKLMRGSGTFANYVPPKLKQLPNFHRFVG